jgi:4-hydroxybenzoate polyprenyltransferase
MKSIKSYLSLVKFSHTIFALPFALIGFFIGLNTVGFTFQMKLFVLVLACMITARSAAMAFNRWVDQKIDKKNPRTQNRELPIGAISSSAALVFVVVNCMLFIACTYFINSICFFLSPVALFIVLGYSYTKRFSWLCHIFLGLGLSLAPIGAYLAVTGVLHILPVLFSLAVITWVAGFDILYALQDIEFDKNEHLYSIPANFGISKSLSISIGLHTICALCILLCAGYLTQYYGLGLWTWAGSLIFISLLISQHRIISKDDQSRINLAFFTTNGIASIFLATGILIDLYLH